MQRSKRVIFTAHCVLNQNTVVCPLARGKGAYKQVVETIIANDIGIHQIYCPEFKYLGIGRKPMNKQEYDTKEFRTICKKIAEDTLIAIQEYILHEYEIVGIIGINESPTCSIFDDQGILMEELTMLLDKENIVLDFIDIPVDYNNEKDNLEYINKLDLFLKK